MRMLPRGFPCEFSRGNYFSFSTADRTSDRLSPAAGRRASHVSRGNIAEIFILSYYLISPVTRTNAAKRAPTRHRLIGPRYRSRSCFIFHLRHQSVADGPTWLCAPTTTTNGAPLIRGAERERVSRARTNALPRAPDGASAREEDALSLPR